MKFFVNKIYLNVFFLRTIYSLSGPTTDKLPEQKKVVDNYWTYAIKNLKFGHRSSIKI